MKEDGDLTYDYWGWFDILLNGKSFFENFHLKYYKEERKFKEKIKGVSIESYEDFSTPIFPLIESIIEAYLSINKNKAVIIEDVTGQSANNMIICKKVRDDQVAIALYEGRYLTDTVVNWYDGEKVVLSKEIPISPYNIISTEIFINGCKESVKKYFSYLERKFPAIKDIYYFKYLNKNLER